ncbi:hypothetical protein [Yinghuangia soli]|uniref:Uncharacterized protein n=1 Tax=Yinghuangia soli TaxID=2908204 RepID=A0AA41Q7E0_9ACTN|nr:hypothetical protein [Yinghuangia soli]MCF2532975.1 hypothetical protein [Yinghuangia soli]
MAIPSRAWLAGATAAALTAGLAGFSAPPAAAAPTATIGEVCPLPHVERREPPGYEAVIDLFGNAFAGCSVVVNTSKSVLRVSVSAPNTVSLAADPAKPLDPTAWATEIAAGALVNWSNTQVLVPVGGSAAIRHLDAGPATVSVADRLTQWQTRFATWISARILAKVPLSDRMIAYVNLHANIGQCSASATALWERLGAAEHPDAMQEVADRLGAAGETYQTCKPIRTALDPPPAPHAPKASGWLDDVVSKIKSTALGWADELRKLVKLNPAALNPQ